MVLTMHVNISFIYFKVEFWCLGEEGARNERKQFASECSFKEVGITAATKCMIGLLYTLTTFSRIVSAAKRH